MQPEFPFYPANEMEELLIVFFFVLLQIRFIDMSIINSICSIVVDLIKFYMLQKVNIDYLLYGSSSYL